MSNEVTIVKTVVPVLRKERKDMLPDNAQWTKRFYVKSESGPHLYTVAQHKTGRWWGCNCPGWIRHKNCKHLTANQLPPHMKPKEISMEVK